MHYYFLVALILFSEPHKVPKVFCSKVAVSLFDKYSVDATICFIAYTDSGNF